MWTGLVLIQVCLLPFPTQYSPFNVMTNEINGHHLYMSHPLCSLLKCSDVGKDKAINHCSRCNLQTQSTKATDRVKVDSYPPVNPTILNSVQEQSRIYSSRLQVEHHSECFSESAASCCARGQSNSIDPSQNSTCKSINTLSTKKPLTRPGDNITITDFFNTLSVSNSPNQSGVPPQSLAVLKSCREEAAVGMSYLDDTTVDDLAGYLDEIMFIPKPMSEMAELMYT